jgi:exopolyphosphatase/guanosine-5'-triphosphate,3'-diphosphate pyrophosphatase
MKIASIDIGTNTVLLLVAEIDHLGIIHTLEHKQSFPRLGNYVDKNSSISLTAFDSVAGILQDYKNTAYKFNVDKIITCATSAVRDAANKIEFITHLKKVTDLEVEIISGGDEALLTYEGAISGFSSEEDKLVLDIGGGSTEIAYKTNQKFIAQSLQIGAVRLTERCFKKLPPGEADIELAKKIIAQEYLKLEKFSSDNYILTGVAGTVTTLACLEQGLRNFDTGKVSGYYMSIDQIHNWLEKLYKMNPSEIRSLSHTTNGREDILTAGTLILYEFMKQFNFKHVVVSERGLRYGLVLREYRKQRNKYR